jgi:hypothetical protein
MSVEPENTENMRRTSGFAATYWYLSDRGITDNGPPLSSLMPSLLPIMVGP